VSSDVVRGDLRSPRTMLLSQGVGMSGINANAAAVTYFKIFLYV
jgi:hypothetical protein